MHSSQDEFWCVSQSYELSQTLQVWSLLSLAPYLWTESIANTLDSLGCNLVFEMLWRAMLEVENYCVGAYFVTVPHVPFSKPEINIMKIYIIWWSIQCSSKIEVLQTIQVTNALVCVFYHNVLPENYTLNILYIPIYLIMMDRYCKKL